MKTPKRSKFFKASRGKQNNRQPTLRNTVHRECGRVSIDAPSSLLVSLAFARYSVLCYLLVTKDQLTCRGNGSPTDLTCTKANERVAVNCRAFSLSVAKRNLARLKVVEHIGLVEK